MLPAVALDLGQDLNMVKLARELATDHYPIETVLKHHSISHQTWANLKSSPRFIELLRAEQQAWNAAVNTTGRVRLKSAAVVEEWLLYANRKLHEDKETLSSKIELIKLLGKFGGLDQAEKIAEAEAAGRVTINIKVGNTPMQFDNGRTITSEVIEAEVVQEETDFNWDEEFPITPIPQSEIFFEEQVP